MADRHDRDAASSSDEIDKPITSKPKSLIKKEITKKEIYDPELDAESEFFNPLKALYADNSVIDVEKYDEKLKKVEVQQEQVSRTTHTSSTSKGVPLTSTKIKTAATTSQFQHVHSNSRSSSSSSSKKGKVEIERDNRIKSETESPTPISSKRDYHKIDIPVAEETKIQQSNFKPCSQRRSSFSHSITTSTPETTEPKSLGRGSSGDLSRLNNQDRQARRDTFKTFTRVDRPLKSHPRYGESSRSASASLRVPCTSGASSSGAGPSSSVDGTQEISNPQRRNTFSSGVPPPMVKREIHQSPRSFQNKGDGQTSGSDFSKNSKTKKNLFTRNEAETGPLSLLRRCVEEKLQVRVMTRAAVDMKSICKGYIVAFDKYMNMAMIDVDEIYRRPKILGKVRSRRSHKLKAAQTTLLSEKDEIAKHRERQNTAVKKELPDKRESSNNNANDLNRISNLPSVDISSSSLQQIMNTVTTNVDHGIKSTPSSLDIIKKASEIKTTPSSIGINLKRPDEIKTTPSSIGINLRRPDEIKTTPSSINIIAGTSREKKSTHSEDVHLGAKQHGLSLEKKLRNMKSIYADIPAALSPFERETLMLGVPDENVDIRHLNQLFIRGENIVSVNIVEDF